MQRHGRKPQILPKSPYSSFPPPRVESRLLSLEARFAQLDSSLQSLEHEFDLQAEMLEEDLRRDVPWAPAAR